LAQATLTTVAFTSMEIDDNDLQHINVKFAGIAQSVNSIALQAQIFSKNGVIANPIFSNIGRQPDGVHFSLTVVVNPKAIGYEQMLSASNPQPTKPAQTQTQTQAPASPFGGASAQTPAQTQQAQQASQQTSQKLQQMQNVQ